MTPVLPIPRDPQNFEDRNCWYCGGGGYLLTETAVEVIDDVIARPEAYTDEQAERIKHLAAQVIFGVRGNEEPVI